MAKDEKRSRPSHAADAAKALREGKPISESTVKGFQAEISESLEDKLKDLSEKFAGGASAPANKSTAELTQEINNAVNASKGDPNGQAPVLAFAPYQDNPEYELPYSKTLLDKANVLASSIWKDQESYQLAQASLVGTKVAQFFSSVEPQALTKNQQFFSRYNLLPHLKRITAISLPFSTKEDGGYSNQQKISEFIRKLKKLERKYDADDLVSHDTRQRIIDTVLLPTHMYGVFNLFQGFAFLNLRHPPEPAVTKDILSQDDVVILETLINYIPRLRQTLGDYTIHRGSYTEEELMTPIVDPNMRFPQYSDDGKMLLRLKKLSQFFYDCVPYAVKNDHIAELRHPVKSGELFTPVQNASADLRNAVLDYIKEEKPLSEMLEKIVALSQALEAYFYALAHEVEAGFNFLTRINMTFEQFVKESLIRIKESEFPW